MFMFVVLWLVDRGDYSKSCYEVKRKLKNLAFFLVKRVFNQKFKPPWAGHDCCNCYKCENGNCQLVNEADDVPDFDSDLVSYSGFSIGVHGFDVWC